MGQILERGKEMKIKGLEVTEPELDALEDLGARS